MLGLSASLATPDSLPATIEAYGSQYTAGDAKVSRVMYTVHGKV